MSVQPFTKLFTLLCSIGSNQPFPVKPLSESKNRLLEAESAWAGNGSEDAGRPGNVARALTVEDARFNTRTKIRIMTPFRILTCGTFNEMHTQGVTVYW